MAFKKIKNSIIKAFDIVAEEFVHEATGARWIHLGCDNEEKVFVVGFPTHAESNRGEPHILEHMVLCGSEKFPAKDPFFNMSRRSLATFMNAMTYPDRTVYPFATLDTSDFKNLLSVYLDAVFFPKLTELDFIQEGWRVEQKDLADHNSPLEIKGVVYNEMKGALSSPSSIVWKNAQKTLFQGSPYSFESGGVPKDIPNLTLGELKAFHSKHYHPSNAIFMTFGKMDLNEVMDFVEKEALYKFTRSSTGFINPVVPSLNGRQTAIAEMPGNGNETEEFQVLKGWRVASQANQMDMLLTSYLSSILMGDSSAPLMAALEDAGFGRPGDICGNDSSGCEQVIWVGMQGLKKDEMKKASELIESTLLEISENGVDMEREISVLRDFELSSREIKGSNQPFGMSLALRAMPSAMHGGDIVDTLNYGQALDKISEMIKEGGFTSKLVKKYLLDNDQKADFEFHPQADWRKRDEQAEIAHLEKYKNLTNDELVALQTRGLKLREKQMSNEGVETLPMLDVKTIDKNPQPTMAIGSKMEILCATPKTNGIVYADFTIDVLDGEEEKLKWLSLAANIANDVGVGKMSYKKTAEARSKVWSGIHAGISVEALLDGSPSVDIYVSGKTLVRDFEKAAKTVVPFLDQTRFDEKKRVSFLLDEMRQGMEADMGSDGRSYAILEATAPFSATANLNRIIGGGDSVAFMRDIGEKIKNGNLEDVLGQLSSSWFDLNFGKRETFIVCDEDHRDNICSSAAFGQASRRTQQSNAGSRMNTLPNPAHKIFVGPSDVAYCVMALKAPSFKDGMREAALVSLAASAMTNVFLHRAIREEGGAYGGSAYSSGVEGLLVLSSYRDPRLSGTFSDFGKALDWFVNEGPSEREWLEARLSCLQKDKPSGPRGEALKAHARRKIGLTEELRREFRAGLMEGDLIQAKSIIAKMMEVPASRSAFCGAKHHGEAEALGMEIVDLRQNKG